MYFVYILQSISSERYYTGSTDDLEKRLNEHNQGKNISTRYGIPWKLVHSEILSKRSEAVVKEKQIKARGAARYLKDKGKLLNG